MTESEKILVVNLWEEKKPIKYIVSLLPYKPYVARKQIKEMVENGELKQRRCRDKERSKNKILEIYNNKTKNIYEIAKETNLSFNYVRDILYRCGIRRKRPEKNYKKRKQTTFEDLSNNSKEILLELKNGKTARQISKEKDISTQWIHKLKSQHKYFIEN